MRGIKMFASVCALAVCLVGGYDVNAAEDLGDISELSTELSFEDLSNYQFWFSSGVGAWSTWMTINSDGSFTGCYSDMDMGDIGEGYPDGTIYECIFSGELGEPVKLNTYTYALELLDLSCENEAGMEEIIDGTRYCYSEAYGLMGNDRLLVYLPGAPLEELPEEYLSWASLDMEMTEETILPCFGIFTEAEELGFMGFLNSEDPQSLVDAAALQAKTISDCLENEPLDQSTLNCLSNALYMTWDDVLNRLWGILKDTRDPEFMQTLTDEELDWIHWKEAEIEAAGAEFEGGSMHALVVNTKAAELTEIRVYELLDICLQ